MPDPRTWNRREFSVTPNGFFTVLRPSGWFSAAPLPGGFRYLTTPSKKATAQEDAHSTATVPPGSTPQRVQTALDHGGSPGTELPLQFTSLGTEHRQVLRPALIALAATAITFILLWCTEHP